MKNKIKTTMFQCAFICLTLLSSLTFKAQSPVTCGIDWRVENATNCAADVKVDFYCNGSSFPCNSITQSVPAGSTVGFPWLGGSSFCAVACNPCEVKVTLLKLGSCNLTGVFVETANPVRSWTVCHPPCNPASGTTYDIKHNPLGANLTQIGQ